MKPETLQELRGEIQNAGRNIPVETIQDVCNSLYVVRRYQDCNDARGGQNACRNIPVETIQDVCNSVVRCYQDCNDARGVHFELLYILANFKTKMLFIHVLVQK